ncbi:hypothetical protein [Kitasatospora aureofaciens]|uniref:hypothetical protein n=1 Tax=Kitasatospora aureofaciens TaxID=1894 RepID=UPI00131B4699|nr:hypothetical protein [Kitasatospora aureofaciens]
MTALLACAACAGQTDVAPSAPVPTSAAAPAVAVSPTPSVTVSPPPSSGRPDQQQLDTAADAVSRLSGSYQDVFAGLTVDVPDGCVIVYRKPGGGGFDAALAHLGLSVRIDLRDAPRSISELAATRNRVAALIGHTSDYSIVMVGDGSEVSFARGVVEVGVSGNLSSAQADLRGRFGDRVTVSAAQPLSG